MPSFTDPKAISNFISCNAKAKVQQSQMISVNWQVIPDGPAVEDLSPPLAPAATLRFGLQT